MSIGANTLGVALVLIGCVWALQGLNILGGSFMTGQRQWVIVGGICAASGLILLIWVNFMRR
jgi:hypothetical protein